jgi:HEAT repeat protein
MLMGDDAVPFLIQTLTDENLKARQWMSESESVCKRVMYFLEEYYPDTRALPALTQVFLSDASQHLRWRAAVVIAGIDAKYARQLMNEHLDGDMETQGVAFDILEMLGDKRVPSMRVSALVSRLENPETRRKAAFALAERKDKRAVPVLLEMLDDKELRYKKDVIIALARIGDKRAIPVLLNVLNDLNPRINIYFKERVLNGLAQTGDERAIPVLLNFLNFDSVNLAREVVRVINAFGPSIVPPLLERMKQTESHKIQDRIAHGLKRVHHPELAPIYEQVYLETEDSGVESSMLEAFANMGAVGFEYLLKLAKQKPDYRALHRLSTYNGAAVVDAVAGLALDESYPFRSKAINALGLFGELWKAEISEHIPRLLTDTDPVVILNTLYLIQELKMTESWEAEIAEHVQHLLMDADPEVKFRTIRLIKHLKIIEMIPALQKLTQTSDTQIRNAAHNVLAVLSQATPLKISVEMNRQRYDYGQPVDLTYRITNVSAHPITICTFGMSMVDEFLKLEIQLPDGTFGEYHGPRAYLVPPSREDYQTLKSGDELTVTASVSEFYWLYQPGRYTIQIHYDPFDAGIRFGFLGWTRRLTAPKVHFDIEPPTPEHFNRILARIDTKPSTSEAYDRADKTCHQLGELRKPEAIPALKKLGLDSDGDYRFALAALAKFPNRPELIPMWIEILNDVFLQSVHTTAIKALGASGDPRAIEPLRRASYRGHYTIEAVLALQQLGDDSSVEWFRNSAWRKLQDWYKIERKNGTQMLRQLQPRRNERQSRRNQPPDPQQVLTDAWFSAIIHDRQIGVKWVAAGAKTVTLTDVEGLLKHPNPKIQKSAAYALARLGNASGAHLIQSDLYANDVSTRWTARVTLLGIRPQ